MTDLLQFAFIVVLPLVVIAGALVSLFAVGAIFDAIENPQALRTRVEGAFRPSTTAAARIPGAGHYYTRHWLGGGKAKDTPAG